MFVTYFYEIFLNLALTFLRMAFVLTQYHFLTFISFLCKFELFAACLTVESKM